MGWGSARSSLEIGPASDQRLNNTCIFRADHRVMQRRVTPRSLRIRIGSGGEQRLDDVCVLRMARCAMQRGPPRMVVYRRIGTAFKTRDDRCRGRKAEELLCVPFLATCFFLEAELLRAVYAPHHGDSSRNNKNFPSSHRHRFRRLPPSHLAEPEPGIRLTALPDFTTLGMIRPVMATRSVLRSMCHLGAMSWFGLPYSVSRTRGRWVAPQGQMRLGSFHSFFCVAQSWATSCTPPRNSA